MDNFKIIYKILKYLETAMDYDEVDTSRLSAEALNVSENRRIGILEMLVKEGYVDGVGVTRSVDGNVLLSMDAPRITLKGLEYLQENSIMAKAARTAKGIAEIMK